MARRKRIPFRPDRFQSYGRRIASAFLDRGRLVALGLVLAAVAFTVAVVIMSFRGAAEENAWAALDRAGGDLSKLRRALAEYGSTGARPYALFTVGRLELEPPREGRELKAETEEERNARLARAEGALRELAEEYPDHFLRVHALDLLGLALEERGQHRDAAAVLEEALAIARKSRLSTLDPKIEYDIGRNYYLAGMHEAARRHLEQASRATRTVRVADYRLRRTIEREADWIENARYLKAQLGPGERAIPLAGPPEEPAAGPGEAPPGEETGAPGPERVLDESAPDAKNPPGSTPGAPAAGEGDAAPDGSPGSEPTPAPAAEEDAPGEE